MSEKNRNNEIIISATNFARKILNIDENLWVFINDERHFESKNHSGLYDKEHFLIRYNKSWLNNAKRKDIIKCAFHEVFHAFQHQEIVKKQLGMKSAYFTIAEINQIENEFNDSTYSIRKWNGYLVEKQAEYFSEYLYDFFEKLKLTIEDLIENYYELYNNLE